MHSIPGDFVDLLTRNGTFAFLQDLHETGHLWDLRNFRTPRLVPRGTASKDFGDNLKAILALAERYPAQSLPLYILRAFAHFLPALLMPCSRRGKPSHITINARRFQNGRVGGPLDPSLAASPPRGCPTGEKARRQAACASSHSCARSRCRILRAQGRLVKGKPGHDLGPDPFSCPYQH